jgi:hypothetical protein
MRYVIVQDNKVVGTVFSPYSEPAEQKGLMFIRSDEAQTDWTYNKKSKTFDKPKEVDEEGPKQPVASPMRRVPFLDFMNLLTANEKASALDSEDVDVRLMLMTMAARPVDLDAKETELFLTKIGIKTSRKKAILG